MKVGPSYERLDFMLKHKDEVPAQNGGNHAAVKGTGNDGAPPGKHDKSADLI